MAECPGEGFCERFTGVAGESDEEKFAEASSGCPRKCQSLKQSAESAEGENETEIIRLENLFDEHCAFPFSAERQESLECFEQECLIFWHKTVLQFERETQAVLRIFAEAHFKR